MSTARIVALIPTISPARITEAAPWIEGLSAHGIDVRVVANAASVAASAAPPGARIIDSRSNPGFARSLTAALGSVSEWDWVVLLNDDLLFGDETPARIRDAVASATSDVLLFDPEPARAVPRRREVFESLSLLEAAATRLRERGFPTALPRAGGDTYKSFSAVAISRAAWFETGGLDNRFVFCFEDAFFVRRYLNRGGIRPTSLDVGIAHKKSITTGRHIARVLPAIAYSARTYLEATGSHPRSADALVVAALLVRLALIPFACAPAGAHVHGVLRSLRAVVRRREPALPDYESL